MAIGVLVPFLLFVLVLGGVGIRLVSLWRRTRGVPEGLLGFGLAIVGLSLPLSGVGRAPATALEPIGRICFALGMGGAMLGIALIVAFTYWVFRRGTTWARVGLWIVCGILAGSWAWISLANFTGSDVESIKQTMRPGAVAMLVAILVVFAWGGVEALRYRRAARRQLALGLVDAVIVNRFLLWGIAGITSSIQVAVTLGCLLANMTIMREALPLTVMASCAAVTSATWYLTFFAPEGYLRWVRGRAARAA